MAGTASGERWVGWVSGACAVHCLAGPAVAALLPVAAVGERLEAVALVALLVVAVGLSWTGFRRHRCLKPVWPVVAGLALWTIALVGTVPEPLQAGVVAVGGGLSFWGLTWSRKLTRGCSCDECATAEHP